ncbi:hypothetical protein QLX67_12245, partial [Balneolaceae bacterium ANBcel3]|nr:hypothetical protein [Balneolaceae bacterium ANBcel3]
SANMELARLFHQYQQEIREHLEKECDIQIELEVDQREMDGFESFFGNNSGKEKKDGLKFDTEETTQKVQIEKVAPQPVRDFGYNQMEWTV